MEPGGPSLRDRLRRETQSAHAALDARVSGLDVAGRDGLVLFLRMQVRALTPLAAMSAPRLCATLIDDLAMRARADLACLGEVADLSLMPDAGAYHPQAVDYVIAGSRLGAQVLQRRWRQSGDADVRAARQFFSAPDHVDVWRAVCARAGARPGAGRESDRIVADAVRLFALFERNAAPPMLQERGQDA